MIWVAQLTMKHFRRSRHVLLHVVPQEGAIVRRISVVQFDGLSPRDQLTTQVDFALGVGEIRCWVKSHDPPWKCQNND